MSEQQNILTDFEEAFAKYGRPYGPFDKERQCIYHAKAAPKLYRAWTEPHEDVVDVHVVV